MPKYIFKVEFYGKKLKIEVEAENDFRAEMKVRSRLNIIEVEQEKEPVQDDPVSFLKDFFGMT